MQPLSSRKKIAHNTVFLYIRMILTLVVSLYTVRMVLSILGVEDYGIYNAIGGVVASMSFLTQVLTNASQRFFSIEIGKGEEGRVDQYLGSILFVFLILAIIIFIVLEAGGLWLIGNKLTIPADRFSAAIIVFHVSILTFLISVLGSPFNALIVANEEMNVYAYISIADSLVKLGVVYLLYISPIDRLIFYSILLLSATLTTTLLYIYFSRRRVKIRIRVNRNKEKLKVIISYSSWTLIGTASGILGIQGNSLLLNIFSGPIANAAFAISLQVSGAVQSFVSSFYTAVSPALIKGYSAGDYNYMTSLFYFSNKVIFTLMLTVIFPLFVETEFVLNLWLGQISEFMVVFVRVMLLYTFVLCLSFPITTIVQAAGRVKLYHGIVDGFALLILPCAYLVLKSGFCPTSALISMVIIFVICHMLRLLILKKVINFSLVEYTKSILLPGLAVICFVIFCVVIPDYNMDNDILQSITRIILSVILVFTCSFFIMFSKMERKYCYKLINRK